MKRIVTNRFGLVALLSLSLFASAAFAISTPTGTASAQGPQQVVVTNTGANPVPVTLQKPELYQATQNLNCANAYHVNFTFNVPSGKTLVVRNVNVFAGSYNATDTFGVVLYPDGGSTSFLGLSLQPLGGSFNSWADAWALNQQVQMSATQLVQGQVSRDSTNPAAGCSAAVTISGELF